MRDKSLSDDNLKLVKYRILFVKRGYEAVLDDDSSLVHDNMTPDGFVAWKISEFSGHLNTVPVPPAWGGTATEQPRYPSHPVKREVNGRTRWFINHLDDGDHKHLRVSFEVLNRSARERFEYEEDQVEVLRQIRDALPGSPGGGAPGSGDGASSAPPSSSPSVPPAGSGGTPPASDGGSQGWYVC